MYRRYEASEWFVTGSYAINPFTSVLYLYISDYVLAATERELSWPFLRTTPRLGVCTPLWIEITPVVEGGNIEESSYDAKRVG